MVREIIKNVYTPSIFIQKLAANNNDAHTTITTLLTSSNAVQYGFTKLAMHRRLDLSIEAIVLYPSVHAGQDFSFFIFKYSPSSSKAKALGESNKLGLVKKGEFPPLFLLYYSVVPKQPYYV